MSFFSLLNWRVGFFLAARQLRRASKWTTGLIVFVMVLTFLNLVGVTGILVGLIEGIGNSFRLQYTGDVVILPLSDKKYIEDSPGVLSFIASLPQVSAYSPRYVMGGSVEANYLTRTDPNKKAERTGAQVFGVDPIAEDSLSGLSQFVIEGEYLAPDDYDQILIGAYLLEQYAFGEAPGITPLKNIVPGSKVRVTVGENTREMTVKGFVKSKVDQIAVSIFMPESQFRQIAGTQNYDLSQIAIRVTPEVDPARFRDFVKASGIDQNARVWTYIDSIPTGVQDITNTFRMLGNMISSIGLVVASITIFIVIFINALTRRKFIGILKGIGVAPVAIEISYIFQSLFYACIGSAIGFALLYGVLVPYFYANPIDFPFSDGILYAPLGDTLVRVGLLVVTTVIAGYIPARMIVQRNTLDSILGRN